MNRREFLIYSAALACLRDRAVAAEEERPHPEPPYLKLKPFIEPGHDEFANEKDAFDLKQRLRAAMAAKKLDNAAIGPTSYRQIAPDLAEGVFEGKPADWGEWIESVGHIRRAAFFPLPENLVRFEVASEKDGKASLARRCCGGMPGESFRQWKSMLLQERGRFSEM